MVVNCLKRYGCICIYTRVGMLKQRTVTHSFLFLYVSDVMRILGMRVVVFYGLQLEENVRYIPNVKGTSLRNDPSACLSLYFWRNTCINQRKIS